MNISELICTRISHDLIGNVGAFANAIELLEDEDGEFMSEIVSTLKSSSETLTARLKFFRTAFGMDGAHLEQNELIIKTTADYIKTLNPNHPITFEGGLNNTRLNKLAMLAVMSVADTVIRGGSITAKSDANSLSVSVTSPSALSAPKIQAMNDILQGHHPDNLSLYAPLFYMLQIMAPLNMKLAIKADLNTLSYTIMSS